MKSRADGAWFNDRGECLIEVDPLSLLEAADDSPGFAPGCHPD
jgi:hypothetical protein